MIKYIIKIVIWKNNTVKFAKKRPTLYAEIAKPQNTVPMSIGMSTGELINKHVKSSKT